jgi:hypothetical protein
VLLLTVRAIFHRKMVLLVAIMPHELTSLWVLDFVYLLVDYFVYVGLVGLKIATAWLH